MGFEWHEWLVIILVVLLLAGFIAYKFRDELTFMSRAIETDGTIVNWYSHREKGREYFYPLIEFVPKGGEKISYRAEERCETKPMYPTGTKVKVKYLPSDHKKVKTVYPKS